VIPFFVLYLIPKLLYRYLCTNLLQVSVDTANKIDKQYVPFHVKRSFSKV
jgi:hypothetical protein